MLAIGFMDLTTAWRTLPLPCVRRDLSVKVIHKTLAQWIEEDDFTDNQDIMILPRPIREEAARGTEI
jgi:hypothetical protein